MKSVIVFLLILLVSNSFSQELGLHINLRNAKIDTNKFDWYGSVVYEHGTDSTYKIKVKGSIERDNNIIYYQHSERGEVKYGHLQYLYDTEINTNMVSISGYYPIKKYFKLGVDVSKNKQVYQAGCYAGVKYKWFHIEIVFFDKLIRLQYELSPTFVITDCSKIGFKIDGIFTDDKFKWNGGLTYKINIAAKEDSL